MSPASNNSASSDQAAVMLDTKATARSSALEFSVGEYAEDDELDATIGSTRNDRQDMARLGRKQELGVRDLLSAMRKPFLIHSIARIQDLLFIGLRSCMSGILGIRYCVSGSTDYWDPAQLTAASSMGQGLYDGGRAGLIWSYVWVFIGFLPIVVSIAEMASMAPTSGGQVLFSSDDCVALSSDTLCSTIGFPSLLLAGIRGF